MRSVKTFVLGLVLASASVMSASEGWASPLVPVVPSTALPIGPTRGERAVMAANEEMSAIAVGAIELIQEEFVEAQGTLASLSASRDVHQRAVRIAKSAGRVMMTHQARGQRAMKIAYKQAKIRVLDVGGNANDLADLKQRFESQKRYLDEYGDSFVLVIRQIAEEIEL